jgi:hypothetical protein
MKPTSKQTLQLIGSLGISLALTGCVVAIGGTRHSPPPAPPAPPAVVITDSADAATIAEIDAAAKLSFDNHRTHALTQILERSALATPVQVHLINVAYRCLDFDNNKTQVLSRMIARPDFNDATRHAIVSQLRKLDFENNRQHILQQISDRLKQSPAQ